MNNIFEKMELFGNQCFSNLSQLSHDIFIFKNRYFGPKYECFRFDWEILIACLLKYHFFYDDYHQMNKTYLLTLSETRGSRNSGTKVVTDRKNFV